MWTTVLWNHPLILLQWSAVIGAALAGAAWDVATRRIPNALTLAILVLGLLASTWCCGTDGFIDALLGSLILGVPFVVLFVIAGGGAGDAKLMAALGAWLGVTNSLLLLVCVTSAGAVLGLFYALFKNRLRPVFENLKAIVFSMMAFITSRGRLRFPLPQPATHEMLTVPYGVSILVGVCLAAGGRILWPA